MDEKLAFVLGTRPEVIKLSPVIHECEQASIPYCLVHTGQHYSDNLDAVFFEELELPRPDYNLRIGSGSHGEQTGRMVIDIEQLLLKESPETVIVQGDTNTVMAGAIATSKLDMDLAHVEAGLRSFNRAMPEEINRIVADHVADYLFAPTGQSKEYLLSEGIPSERISVTGNTVVDALYRNQELSERKSDVLTEYELDASGYFLMTAHRAENVDDRDRFSAILRGIASAAEQHGREVIYPIHPRAENRLRELRLSVPDRIRLIEPQEYLDFLQLEANARLILTDSGGVQEEACILHVPCVTVRDSTERPETLQNGANRLVGFDTDSIREGVEEALDADRSWENPFGDGRAAHRILRKLVGTREIDLL